ncbi:MAG: hypothetical protein LBE18_01565 [Planctomycetaceae bacterium]|jgi:hypothetical protein|nr:hypothetical protein [Planctomycetaceae bacterium]
MKHFTGLIFGNTKRPEFQFLHDSKLDFIRKIFIHENEILSCRDHTAADIVQEEIIPDIIMIAQSYPDQFPANFMFYIKRRWQITPVILITGVDNCGECRTGTPIAGCLRIYAYEWNEFWYDQLCKFASNNKSIFSMPPTCSDDEIFLAAIKNSSFNLSYENSKNKNSTNKICLIVTHEDVLGNDYAMNKLLADYAISLGYSCEFNRHNLCVSPNLVLIDIDDSRFSCIIESIQRLRCLFADSIFNVYINSPRFNEIAALRDIGVVEVIPKPFFW